MHTWFLSVILLCVVSITSGDLKGVLPKLLSVCLVLSWPFSWDPNLNIATSCLSPVGYPTGYLTSIFAKQTLHFDVQIFPCPSVFNQVEPLPSLSSCWKPEYHGGLFSSVTFPSSFSLSPPYAGLFLSPECLFSLSPLLLPSCRF